MSQQSNNLLVKCLNIQNKLVCLALFCSGSHWASYLYIQCWHYLPTFW